MKQVELLAPAGSFDALKAAVQNGCDAVYLGGSMFGARAFANNFNEEEMIQAVAYAHIYGVRVFVTLNTLIKEHEIDACVRYARFLYEHDVDALIIQDIGLFSLLKEKFPDMELHASTQMHIHNPQGIQLLKEVGAKRVVVPRETSIESIAQYSKLGIDIEVFVQGALCVSYSGQCLMSSMTLHRSGNRGECAQNCRMQYDLEKEMHGKSSKVLAKGKYLLSPKDLNTLAFVPQLIEAGIASFKIEGRMKRPEYVALMVSLYRKAIDAYYAGKTFVVDMEMQEAMEKIFHRGFTSGHLFHKCGSALMNPIRPNHIGIEIGTIIHISKDKMVVKLVKPIYQGDGIRILKDKEDEGFRVNRIYKDGLLVNHAKCGDRIELDKTMYVEKGNKILKTSDVIQLNELQESYMQIKRRVKVYGAFYMKIGELACLEVMDDVGNMISVHSSQVVEKALKTSLEEERIDKQLHKSKDTPFDIASIEYHVSQKATMPIRELNQMRRDALEQLEQVRKIRNHNRGVEVAIQKNTSIYDEEHNEVEIPTICTVVHTLEQYQVCLDAGIKMIFVEGNTLYEQVKDNPCVYHRHPRVMKHKYGNTFEMIQEHGGVYDNRPVFVDSSLNVTNSYSAAFLHNHHANAITFSLEQSIEDCAEVVNAYQHRYDTTASFVYTIYGRNELMLSEYCPINAVEKDSDKKNCGLCRGAARYTLVDMKKHRYPIMCDNDCRMHLLHDEPRNHISDIPYAKTKGIEHFLCVFTIENRNESEAVLQALQAFI